MNVKKEVVKQELLEGIYKYAEAVRNHKTAILERENLDSLVKAYEVLEGNSDDIKRTLKETFNL